MFYIGLGSFYRAILIFIIIVSNKVYNSFYPRLFYIKNNSYF
nr:MAG TPA: hypothetical protein [Caudoviricetes sp.]